jgi:hypothetical protein
LTSAGAGEALGLTSKKSGVGFSPSDLFAPSLDERASDHFLCALRVLALECEYFTLVSSLMVPSLSLC